MSAGCETNIANIPGFVIQVAGMSTNGPQSTPASSPPITLSDVELEAALEAADLPALMCALVHLNGDMAPLRGSIRPVTEFLSGPDAGLSDADKSQIRSRALQVLQRWRDAPGAAYVPDEAQIREMLNFLVGKEIDDDYVEFLISELAMDGQDPYAQPLLDEVPASACGSLKVLIIGAGMSGLLAAIRLQAAGIAFQIIEKNADVGGTWFENRYPGCRVDSANHVYSYSFRPNDWPQHFSEQEVLRNYFSECADEYDLRAHIQFETEVTEARFDAATSTWRVQAQGADGEVRNYSGDLLISAVGQLNRPKLPELPGIGSFNGPAFHSARWQQDCQLEGKRVGVIGTGASAFQFVPIIAEQAQSVTVFQRTPPWVVRNPDYFQDVPEAQHWLLKHVPFYAKWYRFAMFWRAAEGLLEAVAAEQDWQGDGVSVGSANETYRAALLENLRTELGHDPELLAKCTPDYPPGAKRGLIDDGTWLRSLTRQNVHLETEPLTAITPQGVQTASGQAHEFDILIYATGFTASDFLMPMQIFGESGQELHDVWAGEPRAFKGVTVPGFPNLFCCYGPNTNIVVNGSIVFFSECEVRYILGCIALLLQNGKQSMAPKPDAHARYNEWIDAGNANMAWGQSTVNTWYKNASGHITQNWPFTLLQFWQQSRTPDPEDYVLR